MQATRPGFISSTLGKVVPFSHFFETIGLRTEVTRMASSAVRGYQRYLSPRKGFSCAHRKLYGSDSCSEHFRWLVAAHGLSQAIPLFQQRLEDCQQANDRLKMSSSEESDDTEESEPAKAKNRANSGDWCNADLSGCNNCGDLPSWGACDSNHNGALDSGDCSGSDVSCDGIEVSGCDCNF